MRWSYKVARVAGIDVKVHITFLFVLAWFGAIYYQQGGGRGAAEGIGFTLLLFLCVLLHEFGHAFAARAYGIRTPDITLLPIGGVARLERMPDKPSQELVVALAGPAVNVVIAGVLFAAIAAQVRMSDFLELDQMGGNLLVKLLAVNVMLVVFNAIPAFPMDGGRVLRALLAMQFDYVVATTVAARVGQVLAVGFAVLSFTDYGSPFLLFIAMFVFMGAQQELAFAKFRASTSNRKAGDVMHTQFASVPAETAVSHALAVARASGQPFFPVIDHQMRAVGVVTSASLERAVAGGMAFERVDKVVDPPTRLPAETPLEQVVRLASPNTPIVVENPAGQIVGVLSFGGA